MEAKKVVDRPPTFAYNHPTPDNKSGEGGTVERRGCWKARPAGPRKVAGVEGSELLTRLPELRIREFMFPASAWIL